MTFTRNRNLPRLVALGFTLVVSNAGATQHEVLRYFSISTVKPLVDYCAQYAPERMSEVQRGFDNYVMRLDDALKGRQPTAGIPETLTPELAAEARVAGDRLVQSIRHVQPAAYCAWLASRLSMTTREMVSEGLDQFDRQAEAQRTAPKPR